ncbi:MAG: c-type cytochrome [Planctomycetaceae bacterium]|nr:c-type cytochrome [Planctomycetaceae bacterium]
MQLRLFSWLFVLVAAFFALKAGAQDDAQRAKDALIVRTLLRLPGVDLSQKPEAKAALLRYLEGEKGTEKYLEIVEKFALRETKDELLRLAVEQSEGTLGVKAAGLLVKFQENELLAKTIADPDPTKGAKLVAALGLLSDKKTNDLLSPLVTDEQKPLAIRSAAVTALGRNAPGQRWLLATVEQGKLPADLKFAAANALLSSADEAVKSAAGKHLSLPATAGGQPLPPIAELVKRMGDAARGKELYATTGTCAKCHKVKGEGKEVGPDLSEIGSKLSKEALYLSILDPSAGVSFNYETWAVRTLDGTVLSGVLVSQTDEAIELKTAEAIVHKLARDDIDQMKKQAISLMPADIQKLLKAQDLVDIVEYLTTLKKPGPD